MLSAPCQGLRLLSAMASGGPLHRPLGKLVAAGEEGPATALLVCDIQERFRDTIVGYPAVIDTARRLVRPCAPISPRLIWLCCSSSGV